MPGEVDKIMNVIRKKLNALKKQGCKAFIPYLTYGFPDRKTFAKILLAVDACGPDFIEIGLPFSDPVADGPMIQQASQTALDKGATVDGLFADLKRLKSKLKAPLLLMTYYNPVFHAGDIKFCQKAKGLIEGLVVPDLLPEEAGELIRAAKAEDIDTIFFIAPTTDPDRYALIDKSSSGFIYYVSVTGTTGSRTSFSPKTFAAIAQAKRKVKAPVCVGFGISRSEHVRAFNKVADGVIVGSAIVRFIGENCRQKDFLAKFKKFIQRLKE